MESKNRNLASVRVSLKTRVVFLLILICVPMVLALGLPVSGNGSQLIITNVDRDVYYEVYGMTLVTDTITVYNPGPEPAFSVLTAYPLSQIDSVKEFRAETLNGTALLFQRVPIIGPNCTGWQIFLHTPIMPNQNTTIKAQMAIAGLTSQIGERATIAVPVKPTSPYFIQSYETRFSYFDAFTAPTRTLWSGNDVHPFSFDWGTSNLEFDPDEFFPLITYSEFHRQFSIDPWGYLFAHEVHTLQVDSNNPRFSNADRLWRSIQILLPPGSQFLRAYDSVANLSSHIETPANISHPGSINVDFQYHLEKGDTYTFYFEYRIPLDHNQLVLQTGQMLFFDLYLEYPFLIHQQTTEFLLPTGSWLQGVPLGAMTSISPTGQYLVSIKANNVTSITQSEVNLNYVYPILPAFTRPVVLLLFVGIFCIGYVIVRRVPFFREEEEEIVVAAEVDPAILSEFCALYGEKIALLLQSERLEKTMLQGKISKPRYRKEKKNFERKIRALDKELAGRSQPLIEAGGKYESSVRQLELMEAERVSAIEALHALEQRYRQKRITASVYQKLQKDLQKRRDKAVGRMDRILLALREEIAE